MIQVYIAPGRYACHHFFVVKLQTTLLKLESIFEQIDTSFCAIQVIIWISKYLVKDLHNSQASG